MAMNNPDPFGKDQKEKQSTERPIDTFFTGLEQVLKLVGPARDEISNFQAAKGLHINADTNMDLVRLHNEVQVVHDDNTRLANTSEEQRQRLLVMEIDRRNAQSESQQLRMKVENHEKMMHSFVAEIEQLKVELENKTTTAEKYRVAMETATQEKERVLLTAQKHYEENVKRLEEMEILQQELTKAKSSLGVVVGNNPNTNTDDISKMYGLSKVAQLYSALYNNQWTDALEASEKHFPEKQERFRIRTNEMILMNAYRFCKSEKENQRTEMMKLLYHGTDKHTPIPEHAMKILKTCQRDTGDVGLDALVKKYQGAVSETETHADVREFSRRVPEFERECVRVCWLMAVQDPPVLIAKQSRNVTDFDSSIYREYTQSGDKIEYVVWPALIAQECGPVIAKGVARCYKSSAYASARSLSKTQN